MVKAVKAIFSSEYSTWIFVVVVIFIFVILAVFYFGKSKKTETFREHFAQGSKCMESKDCGGNDRDWSCFDNAGGTKQGYCVKRCISTVGDCNPLKYKDPLICRGNSKEHNLRGFCMSKKEWPKEWNFTRCQASKDCNDGYSCWGNSYDTGRRGLCVKKCEGDEDCGDTGECVANKKGEKRCLPLERTECDDDETGSVLNNPLERKGGKASGGKSSASDAGDEGFSNYYENFASKKTASSKKPSSTKKPSPAKKPSSTKKPSPAKKEKNQGNENSGENSADNTDSGEYEDSGENIDSGENTDSGDDTASDVGDDAASDAGDEPFSNYYEYFASKKSASSKKPSSTKKPSSAKKPSPAKKPSSAKKEEIKKTNSFLKQFNKNPKVISELFYGGDGFYSY